MPHAGFKLLHHAKPPDVDRLALAATGPVTRLVPQGNVKAIVLLLSDRDGWTATMQHDAKVLSGAGIAVAGVDTPRLLRRLAGSRASCISLNWSLSLLAKDFEHRLGLPVYMRPILAGRGLGGDVTFASLAQSPNIFRGGVSLGFDGQLPASKAWCTNRRPLASRLSGAHAGWQLRTGQSFTTPWVVIASRDSGVLTRPGGRPGGENGRLPRRESRQPPSHQAKDDRTSYDGERSCNASAASRR